MIRKDDIEKFLISCYENGTLEDSLEVKEIDNEIINKEVREIDRKNSNSIVNNNYETKNIDDYYNIDRRLEEKEHNKYYKEVSYNE